MSDKVFDIFYKKKGQKKASYVGAGWENKFAEEQRTEGKEPWIDLNLAIYDKESKTRTFATEIRFGNKVLKLGKTAGVYLKCGMVEGLTVGELDTGDGLEDAEEGEEPDVSEL